MITLYTRTTCPRCVETKDALDSEGISFTETVIDVDVPAHQVSERFPGVELLPILAVGRHAIAGLPELRALIANDQVEILETL